jgi:hypothetical protein
MDIHSRTPDCFWRQHKTQNTTHTDTTTNKMGHATLPSSSFAPSLSMGRAVAPPNHGAATPQCHAQATPRQGLPLSPAFNKAKLCHLRSKILATKWRMDIGRDGYWKPHVINSSALSVPKISKAVAA